MKKPVTVTITGAAGQIGYALAFRVASGQLLGNDQPVNLHLLEIPPTLPALQGVVMELNDCAFPLLNKVIATDDAKVAFRDSEVALLVGARPRGPGMERKDLLLANAQIFSAQGKAMNEVADRNIRVLVVGNPANTNALIARANAKDLNPRNFTAIIKARGASSAASAAAAAIDHVHTWVKGTADGDWVSMAVPSDGSYGIPEGVVYSYPVTTKNGEYSIVQGLSVDEFSRKRMDLSNAELREERDGVKDLL